MENLKLTLMSQEEQFFSGEIKNVFVPGEKGNFEVLRNHQPIEAYLNPGKVRFTKINGENVEVNISEGMIRVFHNEVYILCSSFKA